MKENTPKAEFFAVSDPYRTNPMSLTPGGSEIAIQFGDNQRLSYANIKMPGRYLAAIIRRLVSIDLSDFYELAPEQYALVAPHIKAVWVDGACHFRADNLTIAA